MKSQEQVKVELARQQRLNQEAIDHDDYTSAEIHHDKIAVLSWVLDDQEMLINKPLTQED